MIRRAFAVLAFMGTASLGAMPEAYAATYTVTNTNDSNAGSLRQAILNANATGTVDTIEFAISGAGPHTINLGSGGDQALGHRASNTLRASGYDGGAVR